MICTFCLMYIICTIFEAHDMKWVWHPCKNNRSYLVQVHSLVQVELPSLGSGSKGTCSPFQSSLACSSGFQGLEVQGVANRGLKGHSHKTTWLKITESTNCNNIGNVSKEVFLMEMLLIASLAKFLLFWRHTQQKEEHGIGTWIQCTRINWLLPDDTSKIILKVKGK